MEDFVDFMKERKICFNGKTRSCVVCLFIESATPRFVFFFQTSCMRLTHLECCPSDSPVLANEQLKFPFLNLNL